MAGEDVVLEERRRLSESLIWDLQRRFYDTRGPAAWAAGGLPWYVTSNAFIASAYARVIAGFLRDADRLGWLARDAPVYVVELASGSGHFAFLLLRELTSLRSRIPVLASLRLRVVMTDFTETNLAAFARHERLMPFVDSGDLDFALFDIERDDALRLRSSGEVLAPGTLANPLVVAANYAFDSTRQDAFRVKDGRLFELLATTTAAAPVEDREDPALMARVKTRYDTAEVARGRYADPVLDDVVHAYGGTVQDASFLVPVAAFDCVRRLAAIAADRMLLVSADKGVAHLDELTASTDPARVLHGHAFSMLVNFHSLGEYALRRGGTMLATSSRDATLKVAALLLGGGGSDFPETALAFGDQIERFGPHQYFHLLRAAKKHPEPPLELVLALLRIGAWDYRVVLEFATALVKTAGQGTKAQQRELKEGLARAQEGFYAMDRDLPFEIGRIHLALRRPVDALRSFTESLRLFKEHPATLFNAALCLRQLGNRKLALQLLERVLVLSPGDEKGKTWRDRVAAEIAAAPPAPPAVKP